MVNIPINGQNIQAKKGANVLQEAKDLRIDIPTLCYHNDLNTFGACRLCTVEVKTDGAWKHAAALLYYEYPGTQAVRVVAEKLGVEVASTETDSRDCILCGLCTRTCHEIVRADALKFQDRGLGRSLEEPEIEFISSACIGCGSCAYICPTGFDWMQAVDGKRMIWDKVFKVAVCNNCGRYFAPVEQLEFISRTTGVPVSNLMTCVSCH